jgi:hypothetical protein
MTRVKTGFEWHRSFSCIPGPVPVAAGAPVQWHEENKTYYVDPRYFAAEGRTIEALDASSYGCAVARDNVEVVA